MSDAKRKFVFIDRDGTMGGLPYLEHPWEYEPYPFTREAFSLLRKNGFTSVVITNQACFARGKAGDYDFAAEFRDIGADDWFICPHDSADGCGCRKPKPGLLLQAREKYGMDFENTYMVGDRWSDMVAGGSVGCKLVPVMTCKGPETFGADREKWAEYEPVYVARDLLDAAKWIVTNDNT